MDEHMVARPQLIEAMTRASQRRIVYVCGATGWGKSWAVGQYLAGAGVSHERFSALDEALSRRLAGSAPLTAKAAAPFSRLPKKTRRMPCIRISICRRM